MIYKVKDIKDTKMSKTGKRMIFAILTDGVKDYPVTFFDRDVMVGDEVDGTMGEYSEKWKNYPFRVTSILHTPDSKKGISDDIRQSNIAFESFFASSCNLLQGQDEGAAVALAVQLHTYLMEGRWLLFATKDQIKKLVAKFGGVDTAKEKAYEKYGVPYLHLLTFDQAEKLLSDG